MANVLVIDDDKMICDMLCRYIKHMKHVAEYAQTLEGGLKKLSSTDFDVVILDVRLPDGNGLASLPVIFKSPSNPEVIIITGEGEPDGAELAVKSGCWDYIEKPISPQKITLPLGRVLQYRKEKTRRKPAVAIDRKNIAGDSPRMRACFDFIAQAANSAANALITGETGTGKELFSRAIHNNSPRADKNFVVVDCAALPETLVESILFGHKKGAYTGADKDRIGLVEQADGGTLFLDEVGELPLSIQKKFLRVLQEHTFRPVGGRREVSSDFRLVSATNQDLEDMMQAGKVRNDFLYRIQTLKLTLPSLRESPEDIKDIVLHHLTKICDRENVGIKGVSADFFEVLAAYDWPGNTRQLVSALESALAAASHDQKLYAMHLPADIRVHKARSSVHRGAPSKTGPGVETDPPRPLPKYKDFRKTSLKELERSYLKRLMSLSGNNIKEACRISGLAKTTLYDLLKKHGIPLS